MKHIPNILSCIRILLIPLFVFLALNGREAAAGAVLIVSGITDMLDGYLARRFNWITQLGKVLDPIADKLTQISVYIVLIIVLRQYWILFSLMILKDLLMLVLGYDLIKKGVKLEGAKWFGKIATTVFYVAMVALLLFPSMNAMLKMALIVITLACVLISALLYVPEYRNYRKNLKKE